MIQNKKVILLTMNLKEMENINIAKEDIIMEIGLKEKRMEKENMKCPMEKFMKENLLMINFMEKEN
jgi:hypothetical protein